LPLPADLRTIERGPHARAPYTIVDFYSFAGSMRLHGGEPADPPWPPLRQGGKGSAAAPWAGELRPISPPDEGGARGGLPRRPAPRRDGRALSVSRGSC